MKKNILRKSELHFVKVLINDTDIYLYPILLYREHSRVETIMDFKSNSYVSLCKLLNFSVSQFHDLWIEDRISCLIGLMEKLKYIYIYIYMRKHPVDCLAHNRHNEVPLLFRIFPQLLWIMFSLNIKWTNNTTPGIICYTGRQPKTANVALSKGLRNKS